MMNAFSEAFAEAAHAARNGETPQTVVQKELQAVPPFKYAHCASMAAVGDWKGVIDTSNLGTFAFIIL